jgi:hypothetical protein
MKEYKFLIEIGQLASGKTFRIKKHIRDYIIGKKRKKENYKVVIIDCNDEYEDVSSKTVTKIEKLDKIKNKVIRLVPSKDVIYENEINFVCSEYTDGLLVIEDNGMSLIRKEYYQELIRNHTNKRVDIITTRHSISSISESEMNRARYIVLHHSIYDFHKKGIRDGELFELAYAYLYRRIAHYKNNIPL